MIIADTGFWVALANRKDDFHERAKQRLHESFAQNIRLITTCAVMTEATHLISRDLGTPARQQFMQTYKNKGFRVFELGDKHSDRLVELMTKYADLPMDLADASLVLLAEQLGHGRILTTDRRDFRVYRWNNREPFENLLEL